MYCENCKSEIEEGTKFCTQCGTAIVLESKIESKIPKSTSFHLFKSMTKSELFVGGIILLSLIVQAIMVVRSSTILEQTQFVYPIVCAVIAIIIYIKNNIFELKRIIVRSLIAFFCSPVLLWILMVLFSCGEYEVAYYLFAGLIPTVKLIITNVLWFYLVILGWFFGYTIIKKFNKTNKG